MMRRKYLLLIIVVGILLSFCASPPVNLVPLGAETVTIPASAAAPNQTTTTPRPTNTQTPTKQKAEPTPIPATFILEPTPIPITEIIFTGSLVPARCVQEAVDQRGQADFLYDDVRSMISEADLAVGTLNATISDFPPHTGCIQTFVLVGGANNAEAMAGAGFDLMSLATNHIKNCGLTNCGDRAFFETLDNLHRVRIDTVGAGEDLGAALAPVVVTLHGTRFGFVSLGEIEPSAFASTNSPGIAVLTDENLVTSIAALQAISDVVIVMPHWGPEYSPMPSYAQLRLAQVAVEAGADLVVGNHAHVIQGYQNVQGIPVFYGLGSFVFDQSWSLETQQGLVLRVRFLGKQLLDFELIPVHIDPNGHVYPADPLEAQQIITRIDAVNDRIPKLFGEK
ncbi:MAG: CapA family protein [Anaerolineae bacterium]|nr:CapA family protein [Anaerolineae bacterium]